MEYRVITDYREIDFNEVREVIANAGLTDRPAEVFQKAFKNSYLTVFVILDDKLVGVGRAISDGTYEAGIYDLAVLPEYQGKGLGRMMMDELMKALDGMNVILYARPGAENFYKERGFRNLLTGMILFVKAEIMQRKGFTD